MRLYKMDHKKFSIYPGLLLGKKVVSSVRSGLAPAFINEATCP
jgi:hypothetical protein